MKCTMGVKTVYTKSDLNSAVRKRQEKIIIKGKLAKKVYRSMNGGAVAKKVTGAALGIGSIFFAPLVVPGLVMLCGKELWDYEMIKYEESEVIIELKEEIQARAKWV